MGNAIAGAQFTGDLIEGRFEILQSLKDALKVYGSNGVPDEPSNLTTKVKTNILPDQNP